MANTVQLDIVTPERLLLSEQVNMVIIPGTEGEFGVLPNHAPLVSGIKIGAIRVLTNDRKDEIEIAVSGGFVEVRPDKVTILAETAERSDEIDVERAEQAKRRAEERLAHLNENINVSRAEAALKRAINRLRVAKHDHA